MNQTRAVCLNCMDGRAQLPVIHWIKDNHNIDHVDMITEPGMDGLIADQGRSIEDIKAKVNISIERNSASMIFVAAHHDCRGNPVSDAEHKEQIRLSVERLKSDFPEMPVAGIWIDESFSAQPLE